MKNLFNIKDKVVVITGGTGVLGKAIALHLAEEGAKVVILGRKAEVGNAIVNEIKTNGGEALFLTTDVMNREILEQNLADILKAYGRIDECSRRKYAGCHHRAHGHFLRFEDRRVPTGA
jgi:NADP-dependent 3-hydroxy acid dehydrogenase YdfG